MSQQAIKAARQRRPGPRHPSIADGQTACTDDDGACTSRHESYELVRQTWLSNMGESGDIAPPRLADLCRNATMTQASRWWHQPPASTRYLCRKLRLNQRLPHTQMTTDMHALPFTTTRAHNAQPNTPTCSDAPDLMSTWLLVQVGASDFPLTLLALRTPLPHGVGARALGSCSANV